MMSTRSSRYRSNRVSSGNDASVHKLRKTCAARRRAPKAPSRSAKGRKPSLELEVDEGNVIDGGIGHDDQGGDGVGGPPDQERLLEQHVAERPILSDRLTHRDGEPGDEPAGQGPPPADPISRTCDPASEGHVREDEHRVGQGPRPENGERGREKAEGAGGPE